MGIPSWIALHPMEEFLGKKWCVSPAYLDRNGEGLIPLVVMKANTTTYGEIYLFHEATAADDLQLLTATLGTSQRCRWPFVNGVIQSDKHILRKGLDPLKLPADGLVDGYTTKAKTPTPRHGWDPRDWTKGWLY